MKLTVKPESLLVRADSVEPGTVIRGKDETDAVPKTKVWVVTNHNYYLGIENGLEDSSLQVYNLKTNRCGRIPPDTMVEVLGTLTFEE